MSAHLADCRSWLAVDPEPDDCTCASRIDAPSCECFVTPEETWLSAASCGYGSGYEPGSQMEWNPDCPAHPPTATINGVHTRFWPDLPTRAIPPVVP